MLFLSLFLGSLLPAASYGQIPRRLENCLPIPSLAQDIEQRREEVRAQERRSEPEGLGPHIRVVRLLFRGETRLSPQSLSRIARSMEARTYDDDPQWLEELAFRIQDAFQEQGYFNAMVGGPDARQLSGSRLEKRYVVNMAVEAGERYRLNRIDILHNIQFSYDELRAFLPIKDGDIFDTHAIRQGMEAIRKAYGERGFVNIALVPDLNEQGASITLILDLAEGKQFRLRRVEVLGLDPALAQTLPHESGLDPGTVYDPSLLDRFFARNRYILPTDVSAIEVTRRLIDERAGTIDITMDFRGCPTFPSDESETR